MVLGPRQNLKKCDVLQKSIMFIYIYIYIYIIKNRHKTIEGPRSPGRAHKTIESPS